MPRACETGATKKSFVRQKTVRTKQGASVEGGRNASTANFKQKPAALRSHSETRTEELMALTYAWCRKAAGSP